MENKYFNFLKDCRDRILEIRVNLEPNSYHSKLLFNINEDLVDLNASWASPYFDAIDFIVEIRSFFRQNNVDVYFDNQIIFLCYVPGYFISLGLIIEKFDLVDGDFANEK